MLLDAKSGLFAQLSFCSLRAQAASLRPPHLTSASPWKNSSFLSQNWCSHPCNTTFECRSSLRVALHCTAITHPRFAISKMHPVSGYLGNHTWIRSSPTPGISEPLRKAGSRQRAHRPSKLTLPHSCWETPRGLRMQESSRRGCALPLAHKQKTLWPACVGLQSSGEQEVGAEQGEESH